MPRKSLTTLMAQDPATLTTGEELRLMIAAGRALHRPYHILFKQELPLCGARCRDGHPCQARATRDAETGCLVRNGRCRLHGGLSTGARTPEGLQRIGEASRQHWARWRQAQSPPQLGHGTPDVPPSAPVPQPPAVASQPPPARPWPTAEKAQAILAAQVEKAQAIWAAQVEKAQAIWAAQVEYREVTTRLAGVEATPEHRWPSAQVSREQVLATLRSWQGRVADTLRTLGVDVEAS